MRSPRPGRLLQPERRQRRRYLTLKNAGYAAIALVVAFLLLSLWSEFRPERSRLRDSELDAPPASLSAAPREPVAIVPEGQSSGQSEPTLLDSGTTGAPRVAVVPPPTPVVPQKDFEPPPSPLGKGQRVTISGGPEGVRMRVDPAAPPATQTTPPPQTQPPQQR